MKAALGGLELRHNARGVISAKFLVANATRPSTHSIVGRFKGDGAEASWVVGTHRGGDKVEEGGARGPNAESALCAD